MMRDWANDKELEKIENGKGLDVCGVKLCCNFALISPPSGKSLYMDGVGHV